MSSNSPSQDRDLKRRAAAGDPEAQFQYGIALLQGGHAAADGPRALAFIDEASTKGNPEAVELAALFSAMGAGRTQSWIRAMEELQRASSIGSKSAEGQLAALGYPGRSLDSLFEVPSKEKLSDSPRLLALPGFATEAECDWVIQRASRRLKRATVFDSRTGDQTYADARDNSAIEFQLQDMDVVLEVLRARISAATRLPVQIFEPLQVLHYAVGEQFRPHHDFLDPNIPEFAEQIGRYGQRIATVLIYLNDDYEGGETIFPKLDISFRGRRGDALFFTNVDRSGRPDPLTTHAGTPPSSGEKWVISQWIRDRAPASPFAAGATVG
jgi:predicted 2-oxoglutarate/Fe(II)-dependent dioxygenase YbiX